MVGLHLRKQRESPAQGLVEFALLLPLLLIFFVGAVDLGRVFYSVIVIQNAARVGARHGITLPQGNPTQVRDEVINATVLEAQNAHIGITNAMVTVTCPHPSDVTAGNCTRTSPLRVTVTYNFNLALGWLFPSPISLQRFTEMMVP